MHPTFFKEIIFFFHTGLDTYDEKIFEKDVRTVPAQTWMQEYVVTNIHVSNAMLLLVLENNKDRLKERFLVRYDYFNTNYFVIEIPSDTCLSFSSNEFYPTLFVSTSMISLPTFSATQEQFIDKVSYLFIYCFTGLMLCFKKNIYIYIIVKLFPSRYIGQFLKGNSMGPIKIHNGGN